jgi:hypothetical protein
VREGLCLEGAIGVVDAVGAAPVAETDEVLAAPRVQLETVLTSVEPATPSTTRRQSPLVESGARGAIGRKVRSSRRHSLPLSIEPTKIRHRSRRRARRALRAARQARSRLVLAREASQFGDSTEDIAALGFDLLDTDVESMVVSRTMQPPISGLFS